MTSERIRPRGFATWLARADAVAQWSRENPELAAAWDEAMDLDDKIRATREHVRAERRRLESIPSQLPRMGVPQRLADAICDEAKADEHQRRFWTRPAMVSARDFVASRKAFLLLYGGAGAGKSAAAAWTLLRAQETTCYGDVVLSVDRGCFIRASAAARISRFDDNGAWARLLRVPWLVIDDLGTEAKTDFWTERVNELLDVRYGNRLRTVLTFNLEKSEFKDRFGERIVSRIRDDGIVAACGGEDLRGKAVVELVR